MRVTESMKFTGVTSQLAQLRDQYQQTVQQATTGKRVNAPSDDPIAAAENARVQASLSQSNAYRKTISLVQGDVQLAESSLDSAGQVLQNALELAMSGSNGTTTSEQYQALAAQANQLVSQMMSIGNTKGSQGYLFGGTRTDTAPFEPNGNFVGNDATQEVKIDDGAPTIVSVSGANAFANVNGRDVIQDLKDLATALSSGDSDSVRSTLAGLQGSYSQVVQERSNAGLILDRLSLTDSFLSQNNLDLTAQSSALTDADATTTLSTLTQLQNTIQQTVAVDQQLLQTTTLSLST